MHHPFCQVLVNGNLEIPCQKPPLEEIIHTTVKPEIQRIIVIKGKVIIQGTLKIGIEYVAVVSDCSQPVHFAHFSREFACFIESPCIKPGMHVKAFPEIEYCELIPVSDKTISKLIIIKIILMESSYHDCGHGSPQNECNDNHSCLTPCHSCKFYHNCKKRQSSQHGKTVYHNCSPEAEGNCFEAGTAFTNNCNCFFTCSKP